MEYIKHKNENYIITEIKVLNGHIPYLALSPV